MIYERVLRQINTIFPKINIKPPSKKATVRPLIQQIQCPNFSNNDFTMLKNQQTAKKSLVKLLQIVTIWIKVVQQNEKARQQQVSRPVDRKQIQNYQYLIQQCQQISNQQDFIIFIKQKGEKISLSSNNMVTLKDYRQVYLCKQVQFYNTISRISEEQYFRELQQLVQKLGILQQVVKKTIQNMSYLADFNNMIQGDQLFRKKDNILNRVINYNLLNSIALTQNIQEIKQILYSYSQAFTFSISRMYYLLFLCTQEIENNKHSDQQLRQIQRFICERPQPIFAKLYNQYITQPLIQLERIEYDFVNCPYFIGQLNHAQKQKQINSIMQKVQKIEQMVKLNNNKEIDQSKFLVSYSQIQALLLRVQQLLQKNIRYNNFGDNHQVLVDCKNVLTKCQDDVVACFVSQNKVNLNNSARMDGLSERSNRKVLSVKNSRLSDKQKQEVKSNNSHKSNNKTMNQKKINDPDMQVDYGQGVFLSIPGHSQLLQKQQYSQKYEQLKTIPQLYQSQCQKYIEGIQPDYAQKLEDNANFKYQQLCMLINVGETSPAAVKQKQILSFIKINLIKPQITQSNMDAIFYPTFRFGALVSLSQKLIELGYKITKFIQTPQFQSLSESIKKFSQARNQFLRSVNRNIDKIIGVAKIISKLKVDKLFNIDYNTYQMFLKILLAQKQVRAYQLSFRDQKSLNKSSRSVNTRGSISQQTYNLINNKLYQPFLKYINNLLSEPYNQASQIVQVLEQIQYYTQSGEKIQRNLQTFSQQLQSQIKQNSKEYIDKVIKQQSKILNKWVTEYELRLKSKKSMLVYDSVQARLNKIKDIVRVCNSATVNKDSTGGSNKNGSNRKSNDIRRQIRDQSAIKILSLIEKIA